MRGLLRSSATVGQRLREEAGFALVEVIVSAVLVVVLATATLNVIDGNAKLAGTSENRTLGSSLAHSELNRLRLMQIDSLADYVKQYPSRDVTVKKKTFTVTSTARWASDQGTVTLDCSSNDRTGAQYLVLGTSVTWPNMGSAQPIRAETIVAPRTSGTDAFRGTLVFKVVDAQGAPVSGVTVTPTLATTQATPAVTGADGCVIFPRLTQGDWTVYLKKDGYIDRKGRSPGQEDVSVAAGQKSISTVAFDRPAQIPVAVRDAPTSSPYTDPGPADSWPTASVSSGNDVFSKTTSGSPGAAATFANVWPNPSGYSAYAGSCLGNDPNTYVTNAASVLPGSTTMVSPGETTAPVNAYLRSLSVAASGGATLSAAEVRITPTGSFMDGCTESVPTTNMTRSGSNASASFDLPFGVWNVCVHVRWSVTSGGWWPTTTTYNKLSNFTFYNYPDGATLRSGVPAGPTPSAQSQSFNTSSGNGTSC